MELNLIKIQYPNTEEPIHGDIIYEVLTGKVFASSSTFNGIKLGMCFLSIENPGDKYLELNGSCHKIADYPDLFALGMFPEGCVTPYLGGYITNEESGVRFIKFSNKQYSDVEITTDIISGLWEYNNSDFVELTATTDGNSIKNITVTGLPTYGVTQLYPPEGNSRRIKISGTAPSGSPPFTLVVTAEDDRGGTVSIKLPVSFKNTTTNPCDGLPSWVLASSPTTVDLYTVVRTSSLFIVGGNGVIISSSNGSSWSNISPSTTDVYKFSAYKNGVVILASDTKVYRSDNEGSTWNLVYTTESGYTISDVITTTSKFVLLTVSNSGSKTISSTIGDTWNVEGTQSIKFRKFAINNSTGWVVAVSNEGDVVRSNDLLINTQPITLPLTPILTEGLGIKFGYKYLRNGIIRYAFYLRALNTYYLLDENGQFPYIDSIWLQQLNNGTVTEVLTTLLNIINGRIVQFTASSSYTCIAFNLTPMSDDDQVTKYPGNQQSGEYIGKIDGSKTDKNYIKSVAYGNGKYVAVGKEGTIIVSS